MASEIIFGNEVSLLCTTGAFLLWTGWAQTGRNRKLRCGRRARSAVFVRKKSLGRSGELIQIELNAALDGRGCGLSRLLTAEKAAKLIPQDAG